MYGSRSSLAVGCCLGCYGRPWSWLRILHSTVRRDDSEVEGRTMEPKGELHGLRAVAFHLHSGAWQLPMRASRSGKDECPDEASEGLASSHCIDSRRLCFGLRRADSYCSEAQCSTSTYRTQRRQTSFTRGYSEASPSSTATATIDTRQPSSRHRDSFDSSYPSGWTGATNSN